MKREAATTHDITNYISQLATTTLQSFYLSIPQQLAQTQNNFAILRNNL